MLTFSFVVLVLVTFVTLVALVCNLAAIPVLRGLADAKPETRAQLLLLFAAAPWVIGAGVLISSLGDIAFGACADGDACLWNQNPAEVSPVRMLVVIPLILATAAAAASLAWRLLRTRHALATLKRTAHPSADPGICVIPTDTALAFAAGGTVFVSSALKTRLSAEQFDAVVLHERAHLQRNDGFCQIIAGLVSASYLPPLRRRLLEALSLAHEESCDAHAAAAVGKLVTASAILAVEQMRGPRALQPGFADGFVAARVRTLLDQNRPAWRSSRAQLAALAGILLIFLAGDVLYYAGMMVLYPALQ